MKTLEDKIKKDAQSNLKDYFNKNVDVNANKFMYARIKKSDLIQLFQLEFKTSSSITVTDLLRFIRKVFIVVKIDKEFEKELDDFYKTIKQNQKSKD